MNYADGLKRLNYPIKKDSKKLENNTYLLRVDGNTIAIRLHDTNVVVITRDSVKLYSGGWRTTTTKDRLNKYAPVNVYQENSIWYIGEYNNPVSKFYEGIEFTHGGKLISKPQGSDDVLEHNKKMLKLINRYTKKAVIAIKKGITLPSSGDCWYCVMVTQDKKSLGDATKNTSHLLNHFKEGYIVPALVWQAVKEAGYIEPAFILGYDPVTEKTGKYMTEWSVENSIKKYLKKRLYKN